MKPIRVRLIIGKITYELIPCLAAYERSGRHLWRGQTMIHHDDKRVRRMYIAPQATNAIIGESVAEASSFAIRDQTTNQKHITS